MATDQATTTGVFRLPLTGRRDGRKGPIVVVGHALVLDDEFTHTTLAHRWYRTSAGYAASRAPRPNNYLTLLHRVVYEHYHGPIPAGLEVDHIDRDPLNCLPGNLRCLSHRKNIANAGLRSHNTTGFTGVHRLRYETRQGRKFNAKIKVDGRPIHLGNFPTAQEAADAVNAAYRIHYPMLPVPNP